MASESSQFNSISNKASIVKGEKYRFTILTDRLIRMEYSSNGVFEDRPTQLVSFRNFTPINFSVSETETLLEIKTNYYTLTYVKNKPFIGNKILIGNTLKVKLNNSDREWFFNSPEVRNFGSISYSLDDYNGNLKLDKGLYSVDGFASLDDSDSYVLNKENVFVKRDNIETDVYLFCYRRDFGLCLKDYYELTGYPSLIPRYALGNWWYKNDKYSSDDIYNLINKFSDNQIPISILVLGDKWHNNINNYTFDNSLININSVSNFLKSKDIKLSVKLNPELGVSTSDMLYPLMSKYLGATNKISLLPLDMSRLPLYFNLIVKPLQNLGVTFFNIGYNDKNNINNLWLLNHYHYTEIPLSLRTRGLILSRNSKIAAHRYPVIYTGRTNASWDTINILPYYNLSASNMGISFIAHALGGFHGGIESSELYIRYIQLGTFSPIFLLASDGGKYYKREPWRWNQMHLGVIRQYMQLRHRLIPYLYSESYSYHKIGSPLMQPFYYKYPKIYDEPLYKNQYFFGSEMFIAPITKKKNTIMNRVVQRIFVPSGTWYDFMTGKKYPGNKYYMSFYKIEDYPVFCKAGAIIPLANDNGVNNPLNLEVHIFPGENNIYNMYEDDGITFNYQNGEYLITNFEYKYEKDNYTLYVKPLEGRSINVNNRNYKFRFRNIKQCVATVTLNGNQIPTKSYIENNDFIVEINNVSIMSNLIINCKGNDIEVEPVNLINNDIAYIIDDLEIETTLKEKADAIMFSDMSISKKKIEIKKLKKYKLEPKFITLFLKLLEYIKEV